jgi:cytochrome c553
MPPIYRVFSQIFAPRNPFLPQRSLGVGVIRLEGLFFRVFNLMVVRSSLRLFAVILLWCFGCTSKSSQAPVTDVSTPVDQRGNIDKGRVLYRTCSTCHGASGEGNAQLHAPSLANLDSWYTYTQLKNFKKGIRGYLSQDSTGFQMATIAQSLKDTTEIQDVIAYIETLADVKVITAATGDAEKGERTYQTVCGSCHGPGAKGNELMHAPRLNGMEPWYLKSQVTKFKMSLRGAHPDDVYGAPMVPMMALLKDEQAIDDVIAYIQSTTQTVRQ